MIGGTKTGEYYRTIDMLIKMTNISEKEVALLLYFLYDSQYNNNDLKTMADMILKKPKPC